MSKPYSGDWVIRSALFVPGHIDRMLAKAAKTEADCVVLDLEDAVPAGRKQEAREKVRQALDQGMFSRMATFVRVNSLETSLAVQDLERAACGQLHGIVYPGANRPEEIIELDSQLGRIEKGANLPIGHLSIIALIETPQAVLNAYAIARASTRMVGLIFGCEDFLAQLQGRHCEGEASLHVPRAQMAMAGRAAGIEPIDTPYVKVHDLAGLRSFADMGRNLGMAGMCALAPDQVLLINEVYTPTYDEIEIAREMVQAADNAAGAQRGVFLSNGKFISPPTLRAAGKTLARHEAICQLEEFKRRR